ncbi:hypothetical protein KY348_03830 [Candidatus Woesearchaeota archaeon]|nr:hypothetical protein [Candidatus Woesearchaeota archaeon]
MTKPKHKKQERWYDHMPAEDKRLEQRKEELTDLMAEARNKEARNKSYVPPQFPHIGTRTIKEVETYLKKDPDASPEKVLKVIKKTQPVMPIPNTYEKIITDYLLKKD